MTQRTKKITKKELKKLQKQVKVQDELRSSWLAKVEDAIGRNNFVVAERKGKDAKDFREILSGEEQFEALCRMARALPRIAEKFGNGDDEIIAVRWLKHNDDYITVASEGYCDMVGIIEKSPNLSFQKALFRACWNACRRLARQEMHSVSALQKTEVDDDGNEVYEIDLDSFAASQGSSPEREVLLRTALEQCCQDETDETIISMRDDGFSDEEIADFLDISRQAVQNRRRRFWERFSNGDFLADGDRPLTVYSVERTLEEIRQAYKPVAEFAEQWRTVTSVFTD